jgi:hypothetical protein
MHVSDFKSAVLTVGDYALVFHGPKVGCCLVLVLSETIIETTVGAKLVSAATVVSATSASAAAISAAATTSISAAATTTLVAIVLVALWRLSLKLSSSWSSHILCPFLSSFIGKNFKLNRFSILK